MGGKNPGNADDAATPIGMVANVLFVESKSVPPVGVRRSTSIPLRVNEQRHPSLMFVANM